MNNSESNVSNKYNIDSLYKQLKEAERENVIKDAMISELLSNNSNNTSKITDYEEKNEQIINENIRLKEKLNDIESMKQNETKQLTFKPKKKRKTKVLIILGLITIVVLISPHFNNLDNYIMNTVNKLKLPSFNIDSFFKKIGLKEKDTDKVNIVKDTLLYKSEVIKRGKANTSYINIYIDGKHSKDISGFYKDTSRLKLVKKDSKYFIKINSIIRNDGQNEYEKLNREIPINESVKILYSNYCSRINILKNGKSIMGEIDKILKTKDKKFQVYFDASNEQLDVDYKEK